MAEQEGKRAVIISNIKSDKIEQAIFILKSQKNECAEVSPGYGIVAEAQEIIDSYIKTMKRTRFAPKKQKIVKCALIGLGAVLTLVATWILKYAFKA